MQDDEPAAGHNRSPARDTSVGNKSKYEVSAGMAQDLSPLKGLGMKTQR